MASYVVLVSLPVIQNNATDNTEQCKGIDLVSFKLNLNNTDHDILATNNVLVGLNCHKKAGLDIQYNNVILSDVILDKFIK